MNYLGENVVQRIMRKCFIIQNEQLNEKRNRLARMGFTSFEVNELIYDIENALHIQIPEEQINDLHTYGDVLKCVEKQLQLRVA